MLEEEDDGLIEDEDEIDQFNDDTFGAGAIGKKETSFFLFSLPLLSRRGEVVLWICPVRSPGCSY